MAKLYNLARMSTATTGTGTITLGSAVTGFLSFASAGVADGDTVTYAIQDGSASEIGRGVYTASGTTLTRSVLKSTNAGSALNLSGQAQVFITPAAEDFMSNTAGSSTDNAIARWDGTGGNTLQNSAVTVADTGAITVTAAVASALAVGRQGATDPVLSVDASTASVATGVKVTGAAAGGGVALAAISSGTNEALTINAKGSGAISIGNSSTGGVIIGTSATIPNAGLLVYDTNASHTLAITPGSNLTANRILTINTGDAARSIDLDAWTAYTPTLTSGTGSVTGHTVTITARYRRTGQKVDLYIKCVLTNIGSGTPGAAVTLTTPVAPQSSSGSYPASVYYINNGELGTGNVYGSGFLDVYKYNGATLWANGNQFTASVTYEVA